MTPTNYTVAPHDDYNEGCWCVRYMGDDDFITVGIFTCYDDALAFAALKNA